VANDIDVDGDSLVMVRFGAYRIPQVFNLVQNLVCFVMQISFAFNLVCHDHGVVTDNLGMASWSG